MPCSPTYVTLSAMLTLVTHSRFQKAQFPMPVTPSSTTMRVMDSRWLYQGAVSS